MSSNAAARWQEQPVDAPSILIVEDEAVVALDLERELGALGYDVAGRSPSGEEALELTEALRPDLVLMDIHLDGELDGIETARRLRSRWQVPVVFLTAFGDDATIERAKAGRPFGYVIKPFQARELRSAIEVALHTRALERELERANETLRAVLDAQRHGAVTVDSGGAITFVSGAAERLLGIDAQAVLGRKMLDLAPLRGCERELAALLSDSPDTGDRRLTAVLDESAGEASALEISAQPDPRDPAGKILFLYDASEVHDLRRLLDERDAFDDIVGRNSRMEAVFQLIRDLAPVDVTVLIGGETGTGKELVARAATAVRALSSASTAAG